MPVARKLWQFIVGGSPALLARRLIIWKTICLFMRVPLSRDLVTSSAWCLGLWTDVAGLTSSDPPETSQSKHLLMADRCCLTDGRDRGRCSDVCRDVDGPNGVEPVDSSPLAPVHEPGDRAVVGLPGVGVADGDGEEVDEPPCRAVVRAGGHRRQAVGEGAGRRA